MKLEIKPTTKHLFLRQTPFEQCTQIRDFALHVFAKQSYAFNSPQIPVMDQPQPKIVLWFGWTKARQ
jgi:hypothetical protein